MRNYYNNKIVNLEEFLDKQIRQNKKFSNIRLLFIVFVVLTMIFISNSKFNIYFGIGAVFILILFEKFLKRNEQKIQKTKNIIQIYQNELDKNNFFGNGSEYINHEHNYTNDLDVFGNNSLFELINRTCTNEGNKILANSLLASANNDLIIERQKAIDELSNKKILKEQFLLSFFIPKNKKHPSIIDYIHKYKPLISIIKVLGFYKFFSPIGIVLSIIIGLFYPISFMATTILLISNLIIIVKTQLNHYALQVHRFIK